jgi:hypothetical protein
VTLGRLPMYHCSHLWGNIGNSVLLATCVPLALALDSDFRLRALQITTARLVPHMHLRYELCGLVLCLS